MDADGFFRITRRLRDRIFIVAEIPKGVTGKLLGQKLGLAQ